MNRMTGEEFLQSKDIWNHPTLTDRNNKECYDVAELLEEYATGEPKRKPLSDGTLPMTDGELDSLAKILDTHKIYGVRLIFEKLEYKDYEGYCYYHEIVNIKAIAYLLERFELIKED